MSDNLFNKVWDLHKVGTLSTGQDQLFIGLQLCHEVTSPQAFHALRENNLSVMFPERTFATADHIVPTTNQARPFSDDLAEKMLVAIEENTKDNGIKFFGIDGKNQGVVHVIGPELGLTQPGMTIICGDSHTSTHGAFGAIAFGVGTTQVKDCLATQTLAMSKPKVRKVVVDGVLKAGVTAKDIALYLITKLGVNGGLGYAYEYSGEAVMNLTMEGRMTLCNMSIEGGARCGYINPDEVTFAYLKGLEYAPSAENFDNAITFWESIASGDDAVYDDVVTFDGGDIEPMVTWGINPGQAIGITQNMPTIDSLAKDEQGTATRAYEYTSFEGGKPIAGTKIDVAFVGSCTNGRISDLRAAAEIAKGRKVADGVKAIIVPGSKVVLKQAVAEGLDKIFTEAGFEWRAAGCSMCLAMNPDKLVGREVCASSSNRNFMGRQGSPTGRTLLMSPAMVAAAAIKGVVTDVRAL
jgi:3-isopropylmalate/(R)-2-methylmalate dehydratase large subunit